MTDNITVSRKPFFLDVDYLLVAFLFLFVLFSSKAFALEVSAPERVIINDKATFFVEVTNNTNNSVDLSVNFFAPIKAEIIAPSTIAPNQKTTLKIIVYNSFSDEREINSKVEITTGQTTVSKNVILVFKKTSPSFDSSKIAQGLFAFGSSLTEFSSFSIADWIIFIILVIIAAVLLIAFIARMKKRV